MTILEKIKSCTETWSGETDSVEKIIAIAYYIGREEATKEISDKYTALLREQRSRAKACRYHKMAFEIIGDTDYIYSSDYAQDVHETFGSDETNI